MSVAIESFDRHGLRAQNDKLIDIPDMTTVLHSLYVTIDQIDLPLMLDLAINWLLNVYDSQRTGQIRVLSFKVTFLQNSMNIYMVFNICTELCLGWTDFTMQRAFGREIPVFVPIDRRSRTQG